jgi:hypothetical protein
MSKSKNFFGQGLSFLLVLLFRLWIHLVLIPFNETLVKSFGSATGKGVIDLGPWLWL